MLIEVNGQQTYAYTGGKTLAPDAYKTLPVVVFIHGAQQDHSCWVLQSRWFAHHGYAVLAPDLPGHGRSAGGPLASIAALSAWVLSLLDVLGVREASFVGHSMGSLVTLQTVISTPERVKKAVLIGSSVPMPVSAPLLDATRDNVPKAIRMVNTFSYGSRAQMGGNRVPGLWHLGLNQRLMERQNPVCFHADMSACNDFTLKEDELSAVDRPVLVISGDQDRMTPMKEGLALQKAIPGARMAVIQGSGHALMAEKPDEVLDLVRGFLAGVS